MNAPDRDMMIGQYSPATALVRSNGRYKEFNKNHHQQPTRRDEFVRVRSSFEVEVARPRWGKSNDNIHVSCDGESFERYDESVWKHGSIATRLW